MDANELKRREDALVEEIVKRFKSMDQVWSGWSATFPRRAFPANAKLSFWALDADEPKLYRLKDEPVLTPR